MKGENFIRVIDDAVTHEQCNRLIHYFEEMEKMGFVGSRQNKEGVPPQIKKDDSCDVSSILAKMIGEFPEVGVGQIITPLLTDYIIEYATGMFGKSDFTELPVSHSGLKIQRTRPSSGYHIWHCEDSSSTGHFKARIMAWILYLNDIEEGGETEFLHLSERVQPKAGRLLMFPAGWTHAHRGNPPLSDTKYIYTGWMEYVG